MRAIMILFDSLRRDVLPAYGGQIPLPNFERLQKKTVVFDSCYAGGLPCMPARRELHTGRYSFLHRSWGPLEPFDDSMPELLKQNQIYTHLATDHYHYIQDGGATYHGRYSSWKCFRGQESDAWHGVAKTDDQVPDSMLSPEKIHPLMYEMRVRGAIQNCKNRKDIKEREYPMMRTFEEGLKFMEENKSNDNWFLQIEPFDPHEPFDVPERYLEKWFQEEYIHADWPPYGMVSESEEVIDAIRKKYYALIQFCDDSLGRVLDYMDKENLWDDTMLIVNTDHGFLLGEHNWWGKNIMQDYNEIVHLPLYIWDPRSKKKGERRQSLVQTIDLAPTLLDYFGVQIPKDMTGKSLENTIDTDENIRDTALFGYHGGPLNITDGRYVLMLGIQNSDIPAVEFTLMPTHMNSRFNPVELHNMKLSNGFSFTKGCKVLEIPVHVDYNIRKMNVGVEYLYDLEMDEKQEYPLEDEKIKFRLHKAMKTHLHNHDAPELLYRRFDL